MLSSYKLLSMALSLYLPAHDGFDQLLKFFSLSTITLDSAVLLINLGTVKIHLEKLLCKKFGIVEK